MPKRRAYTKSYTTHSVKRTKQDMRKFEPLTKGDRMLDLVCPGCGHKFQLGDVPALVAIGPGVDTEARARAREGRPYNAVAVPVHWACASGNEEVTTTDASASVPA
jgi:hypothetical protein